MFSKSNLLATLASGVFIYLGGWAVWGFLTKDFFAQHSGSASGVMKDPSDMLFLILGCLLIAFFMSAIYGKWARGIHSAKEGAQYGASIGALFGLGLGLLHFSTSNISDLTGTLVGALVNIVFYAIAGAIIALVYKATASKSKK